MKDDLNTPHEDEAKCATAALKIDGADEKITEEVALENHQGTWDWSTVEVPPDLVGPLDNNKIVIWNQGGSALNSKAYGSRGSLAKFRADYFHSRTKGDKDGLWIRTSALDRDPPFGPAEHPRKTPLRGGFAAYADFDCEHFHEVLAFAARLSAAGIAFDLVPTGSWGATTMKVEAGPVHKHAGLLDDNKKPLKGYETTASPEDVVAAFRALKPWHPDFAASAQCVLDETGKPKKTVATVRFGKSTEVEVWTYHVSVAPRHPLRLWWCWDKDVAIEGEEKKRHAKNVARFLQLFGSPPYDKCGFTPAQPIYTNRGPVFPRPEEFESLPEGLTYHHDGASNAQKQISYVSGVGTGAVNFDALDVLPDPDSLEWLESKHSGAAHVSKQRSQNGASTFVPENEADEIAHAIISNGAARYGFMAGDALARIVGDFDANGDYVVTDCWRDDHNAAGRRQMFARNGCPGVHGAAYGCVDDNCTDHKDGDDVVVRLTRLLSTALQAGVIELDELPDFFADEAAKFAVARILYDAGKSDDDPAQDTRDNGGDEATDKPAYDINRNTGYPKPTAANVRRFLRRAGVVVWFNEFDGRTYIEGMPGFGPELTDAAALRLRILAAEGFGHPGDKPLAKDKLGVLKTDFYDFLADAGHRNKRNPPKDYFDKVQGHWDGVPRLDKFLHTYFGADDTPLHSAFGRCQKIGTVRRARKPGSKHDEMLILESPQGFFKSTGLLILSVMSEWFSDNYRIGLDGKQTIEQTRGKLIIEVADLSGMGGNEVETLKASLSRCVDRGRASYGHFAEDVPRAFTMWGTTNDGNYLKDITGNRRFWPVKCGRVDVEALTRDRDQLWAEASVLEAQGVSNHLPEEFWAEAGRAQAARKVANEYTDRLAKFFEDIPAGQVLKADVYELAGMRAGVKQFQQAHIREAMEELGWKDDSAKLAKKTARVFKKGEGPVSTYGLFNDENGRRVFGVTDEVPGPNVVEERLFRPKPV